MKLIPHVKADISAEFQRDASRGGEALSGITKPDIAAAVDAVDAWLDDNTPALLAAIPQPVRGALSNRQKARFILDILRRRIGDN